MTTVRQVSEQEVMTLLEGLSTDGALSLPEIQQRVTEERKKNGDESLFAAMILFSTIRGMLSKGLIREVGLIVEDRKLTVPPMKSGRITLNPEIVSAFQATKS